jgi:hypothetical protein
VVADLGSALGLLSAASAAALIGASLLSVLLFPAAALALRPWTRASAAQEGAGRCEPVTPGPEPG